MFSFFAMEKRCLLLSHVQGCGMKRFFFSSFPSDKGGLLSIQIHKESAVYLSTFSNADSTAVMNRQLTSVYSHASTSSTNASGQHCKLSYNRKSILRKRVGQQKQI